MRDDSFDFEPPEELRPWLEEQKRKEQEELARGNHFYIFVNGKIKQVGMLEFCKWFADKDSNRVDRTDISKDVHVSTVFLGMAHWSFADFEEKRPILFESMIFGGEFDSFQWRYFTYGEAKRGHYEIVEALRENRQPEMTVGEQGFWMWFKEMFDPGEKEEWETDEED